MVTRVARSSSELELHVALASLVTRVDNGELKVHVAARRPLTDLAAVHDEAVTGQLAGKTVLIP